MTKMYETAMEALIWDLTTNRKAMLNCSARMKLDHRAIRMYMNVRPSGLVGFRTSGYSTQEATAEEMKEKGMETAL